MQFRPANKSIPEIPWIYHIVHVDRLASILRDGFLFSDAQMNERMGVGTNIGMSKIKERRLKTIIPRTSLTVGQCVPFYYCPRSPMLYVISKAEHQELSYKGGQEPIIHLVFNPSPVAQWAVTEKLSYFVTDVTAATAHFDAFPTLDAINNLNWGAIKAEQWQDIKSEKAAEFLVEQKVPIALLRAIGTYNETYAEQVREILQQIGGVQNVVVKSMRKWYY